MVGRAFAGGNLKELLANVHHRAVQSSLERSTQASANSAVNAWRRFCDTMNVNFLCLENGEPYLVQDMTTIILHHLKLLWGCPHFLLLTHTFRLPLASSSARASSIILNRLASLMPLNSLREDIRRYFRKCIRSRNPEKWLFL